jgi:ribokinase
VPAVISATFLRGVCDVTDVLVVNEHEAAATVASLNGLAHADDDVATFLAARTGCTVVVTLGVRGAIAAQSDGRVMRAQTPRVAAVDTTGAGDTFVGVLAAALAEDVELDNAMARACKAASLACLGLGAQTAMPWRDAILA